MDIQLSEDEAKILLNILGQLNFKIADVQAVLPIVKKLQGLVKEPTLEPKSKPKIAEGSKEITS